MNSILNSIVDNYSDELILKADGFDSAVIGIENKNLRLIYSVTKCLKILMDGGMSMENAVDYFEFNVAGAYVGEQTPIWCYDDF